jgi:hypothetical protein
MSKVSDWFEVLEEIKSTNPLNNLAKKAEVIDGVNQETGEIIQKETTEEPEFEINADAAAQANRFNI